MRRGILSGVWTVLRLPSNPLFMKNLEYIKAEENLKREDQKLYQRKDKRAQVEKLTLMKEVKKPKGKFRKK